MRVLPLRTVLFLTAVCAMVLLYLLWWTTYATIHFDDRFDQRPSGASVERSGGTTIRLVSLTRSAMLADQLYGGAPEQAGPGTTWIVAIFEAVQTGGTKIPCTFEVVGPGGRAWQQQSLLTKRTISSCVSAEFGPTPVRVEEIFLVPERFADQLVGVALLDHGVTERSPVVRPAG